MKRSEINTIIKKAGDFFVMQKFFLPEWSSWGLSNWKGSYGQEGKGNVLIGEVSSVNEDEHDNRFYGEVGRFPAIEEDCPPTHLLVSDYEKYI